MFASAPLGPGPPPTDRLDRIEGAIDAVFDLFEVKQWLELPSGAALAADPEANHVMTVLFEPIVIKRSQLQRQFNRFKIYGKPAFLAASAIRDAQVEAIVTQRIEWLGGKGALVMRAFETVAKSPSLVLLRPTIMPKAIDKLKKDNRCLEYLIFCVEEISKNIYNALRATLLE